MIMTLRASWATWKEPISKRKRKIYILLIFLSNLGHKEKNVNKYNKSYKRQK
jgi:hypothetical protein